MAETPPLLRAINLTLITIDRRIRLYRVLVVCVIIIGISVPLLSIYFQSWVILLALTSVLPAVASYLYVDRRVVKKWATNVLALAREQKYDIVQFNQIIMSFRHLPAATIEGMLSCIAMEEARGANTSANNEKTIPDASS